MGTVPSAAWAYDNYKQYSVNAKRTASAKVDGNPVTMKDADVSANALVPLSIVNTRGFHIPRTGDSGTFLLPVIGLGMASVLTAGGFILLRKKDEDAA